MKAFKYLSILILPLAFSFIHACTKSYTCECNLLNETTSETWDDIKKSDAKDSCEKANEYARSYEGSCELQ